jgi:predicted ATPase
VLRHEIDLPALTTTGTGPATATPSGTPTPPPPADVGPARLRRGRGELIGRDAELTAALRLLADPAVRVVTLLGSGGIGKTRIALAVADALNQPDHAAPPDQAEPDQPLAVTVSLATVTDESELLTSIGSALGARPQGAGDTALDVVVRGLTERRTGSAGPPVLVLDNLEQLIERPGAVDALSAILDRVPGLRLLCTSRAALRLQEEHPLVIGPLGLPAERERDAAVVRRSDAVRLFVERATALDPAFALTDDNAEAVAQVCRLLDGQPLALELAAARARLLPPEEMVHRSGRLLHLLTGGDRDLPERQRSMRAALDWSANLLDDDEAALFAQLSVFSGGWTIAAGEAVCPVGEEPFDLMARLVDKNLVVADGSGRLSMLETVREYAAERLAAGPAAIAGAVRDRHARYYAQLASELGPMCRSSPDATTRARLDAEAGNMSAALEHTAAVDDAEALAELVVGLLDYWFFSGRIELGERWLRTTHATTLPLPLKTQLLGLAGSIAFVQGDLDRALNSFNDSLEAAMAAGNRGLIARCLKAIGIDERHSGRLASALDFTDRAIEEAQAGLESGSPGQPVEQLVFPLENERGEILDGMGHHEEARAYFEAYRQLSVAEGDHSNLAWALANLALNACLAAGGEGARDYAAQALEAADAGGSVVVRGDVRNLAGLVELHLGDPARARDLLVEGLGLVVAAGQLLSLPDGVSVLGAALLRLGDPPGAARLLAAGDAWRQARGMAIVGLLAERTIIAATEDLAALPRTREIEAAESYGLTVRFGWLDALQLPALTSLPG